MSGFDYVVVGAGTAGCVLAARLTEDARTRVLLVEAGGRDDRLMIRMPLAFARVYNDPSYGWGYSSEPVKEAGGKILHLPRGKMLGGSGSINAMTIARGVPEDYEEWRRVGGAGWGYDDVLPFFKTLETSWRGEGPFHGGKGPFTIVKGGARTPYFKAIIESGRRLGIPFAEDISANDREGFADVEYGIHKGVRGSTSVVYLHPALTRPNLTVVTDALVTRVAFEGRRAVGVDYVKDGASVTARAEREVILAAGSYNTPQLLMLSGVGPAEELRAHGIDMRHDLPGVGGNLIEHTALPVIFAAKPVSYVKELRFDKVARAVLQWLLFKSGPAARIPVAGWWYLRTRAELDRTNIQVTFSGGPPKPDIWFPILRRSPAHAFAVLICLTHPKSRGRVRLRSADPRAHPRIELNLLGEARDRADLRQAIRRVRELYREEPLQDFIEHELLPGPLVNSNAELDAHIDRMVMTAHHPVGTCSMGDGPDAVVDAELRVKGLDALRVIDGSVIPVSLSGNTNAPITMLAEKGAALLRGRA